MLAANQPRLPLPPPLLLLLLLLLLVTNVILSRAQQPPSPSGSFYGGSVEWVLLPSDAAGGAGGKTVEFYIRTHWQRSYSAFKGSASDGWAAVGDVLPLQAQAGVFFSFGDNSKVQELAGAVTFVDSALDVVSLLSVTRHTYAAACYTTTLLPAFFARQQQAVGSSSSSSSSNINSSSSSRPPLPLTVQEMLVQRTPWLSSLTACCSSPSSASASGSVTVAAAVDFTFAAASPKLSLPAVVLGARVNVTSRVRAASYTGAGCIVMLMVMVMVMMMVMVIVPFVTLAALHTGAWPCSATDPPPISCQWQPDLDSSAGKTQTPNPKPQTPI